MASCEPYFWGPKGRKCVWGGSNVDPSRLAGKLPFFLTQNLSFETIIVNIEIPQLLTLRIQKQCFLKGSFQLIYFLKKLYYFRFYIET